VAEISKARLKSKRETIRRTYRELKQPATVVELCEQYLKLDPLDGVVWGWAGDSLRILYRYDEARVALQTPRGLVSTDDLRAFVLQCQGELAKALGDNAEAERLFREAIEQKGDHDDLWIDLGHSVLDQGQLEEAERCYRHAATLDGNYTAGALYWLGLVLRARGEFFEARRVLKAALSDTHDQRPALALADVERAIRVRSRREDDRSPTPDN
jgi:tetratricopeptide (TPR) repeat protein